MDNDKALTLAGRKMDEALAKLRRDRAAETGGRPSPPFLPPDFFSSPVVSPASPVLLQELIVCAVHDLGFIEFYERQRSGLYLPIKSRLLHVGEGFGAGHGARLTIRVADICGPHTPCPWCGDNGGGRYHCDCGAVVCGGRVKGNVFTCRDSCGASWRIGPDVKEIAVTRDSGARDWQAPLRGSGRWQAPASAVNPDRLLLPPARRK